MSALVSLTDVYGELEARAGWAPADDLLAAGIDVAAVQDSSVRKLAWSLGVAIVPGWAGRPCVSQADADRLVSLAAAGPEPLAQPLPEPERAPA